MRENKSLLYITRLFQSDWLVYQRPRPDSPSPATDSSQNLQCTRRLTQPNYPDTTYKIYGLVKYTSFKVYTGLYTYSFMMFHKKLYAIFSSFYFKPASPFA